MEIILLRRVEKLGEMGDVVRVKDGYARNFLLPKHFALRATTENSDQFEDQRKDLEKANADKRSQAETISSGLDGKVCVLIRQASEAGQLYGSVTARDVAESISADGTTVVRGQVQLERPIKTLGSHPVRVYLHPEVPALVQVVVARSDEEAERQLQAATAGSAEGEGAAKGSEAEAQAALEASEEFFEEGAGPAAEIAEEDGAEPEAEADAKSEAEPKADKAD